MENDKTKGIVSRYMAYQQSGNKNYLKPSEPNAPQDNPAGQSLAGGLSTLASTMNPYLALGSGALNLYQGLTNQDQNEEEYKNRLAQYNDELNANREAKKLQKDQQNVSNIYTGADFANQFNDSLLNRYKAYNAQTNK
jgi:hypothetical protein